MSETMFAFRGIDCGYADTIVIRNISGQVGIGRTLGIIGRNGVGKSTLMKALAGFLPLAAGQVNLDGNDFISVPVHEHVSHGVAYAPQENVVFGELSVDENLWLHLPSRDQYRYQDLLTAFPRITERLQQKAGLLSGGERKLLSFVRTMGLHARLTLLDEPTEGVQPENIDLMALSINQAKKSGKSFVIVEQNLTFIEKIADEIMVLDHGEIVAAGAIQDLNREQLEQYLIV